MGLETQNPYLAGRVGFEPTATFLRRRFSVPLRLSTPDYACFEHPYLPSVRGLDCVFTVATRSPSNIKFDILSRYYDRFRYFPYSLYTFLSVALAPKFYSSNCWQHIRLGSALASFAYLEPHLRTLMLTNKPISRRLRIESG